MDELDYKRKMAEELREKIYKIPRRNREYELLYQPAIQVNNSAVPEPKIFVKFTLGYGNFAYPCKMLVDKGGAYVHVGSVGPYFDKLLIKGTPENICLEFVQWMKFARYGTCDGKYAFMIFEDKVVGFMVQPENDAYCYVFCSQQILSCGLKPEILFHTYVPEKYHGDIVGCHASEDGYLPNQSYGKGIKQFVTLKPEFRRTLIWSMLCRQTLNQ